ncbi:MAG: hypothetical protein ACJA1C_000391 [Crocinitomicaceae bacterium]|jgi:hypothetical protein
MMEALKICTNVFIVLMLFWMVFWSAEKNHPIKKWWIPKIQRVFIWLGLSHSWNMFSPNPSLFNSWAKIKIILDEKNHVTWEATPPSELNAFEKLKYKKFYKVYHEIARSKGNKKMKRDFIEYLLNKHDLSDKWIKVEVYMVWTEIPLFNTEPEEELEIYQSLIFTHEPEIAEES